MGVEGGYTEDKIYDLVEKICDSEKLFQKHVIKPVDDSEGETYEIARASSEHKRSDLTRKWQTHALQELCDNVIPPVDDEIKNAFRKIHKKHKGLGRTNANTWLASLARRHASANVE